MAKKKPKSSVILLNLVWELREPKKIFFESLWDLYSIDEIIEPAWKAILWNHLSKGKGVGLLQSSFWGSQVISMHCSLQAQKSCVGLINSWVRPNWSSQQMSVNTKKRALRKLVGVVMSACGCFCWQTGSSRLSPLYGWLACYGLLHFLCFPDDCLNQYGFLKDSGSQLGAILTMSGDIFDCHRYWHLVGRGPEMLLNMLQCTGQFPTPPNPLPPPKDYSVKMSTVPKLSYSNILF